MNLYAYVGNDPTNRSDPTGMCDEVCQQQQQAALANAQRAASAEATAVSVAGLASTAGEATPEKVVTGVVTDAVGDKLDKVNSTLSAVAVGNAAIDGDAGRVAEEAVGEVIEKAVTRLVTAVARGLRVSGPSGPGAAAGAVASTAYEFCDSCQESVNSATDAVIGTAKAAGETVSQKVETTYDAAGRALHDNFTKPVLDHFREQRERLQ